MGDAITSRCALVLVILSILLIIVAPSFFFRLE